MNGQTSKLFLLVHWQNTVTILSDNGHDEKEKLKFYFATPVITLHSDHLSKHDAEVLNIS